MYQGTTGVPAREATTAYSKPVSPTFSKTSTTKVPVFGTTPTPFSSNKRPDETTTGRNVYRKKSLVWDGPLKGLRCRGSPPPDVGLGRGPVHGLPAGTLSGLTWVPRTVDKVRTTEATQGPGGTLHYGRGPSSETTSSHGYRGLPFSRHCRKERNVVRSVPTGERGEHRSASPERLEYGCSPFPKTTARVRFQVSYPPPVS